jgi:hypothetical protein
VLEVIVRQVIVEGSHIWYYQVFVNIIICCVCAGDIVELFMRYFRNFGDKPCCVSDLKMFLPLLSNNRAKDFMQKVNETVGLRAGELPSSVCLQEKEL